VGGPIAASVFEVYGAIEPVLPTARYKITKLMRRLVHDHAPPTEVQHLRHERQAFVLTILIESGQNFLGTEDLDDITDT
jgi:hypothetical protein